MPALWGSIWVGLAACGWGTWTLFMRGSALPPSWQSILILTVVAAVSLPAALLRRGRPHQRPVPGWAFGVVLLIGLFDAGNYLCFFAALDRGPIAVAVLTHYLAPPLVALAAPAFLKEKLGSRTLPGIAVALGGLLLLLAADGRAAAQAALITAGLGAASAGFYASNTLLSKRVLRELSAAEVLSYHSWISALLLLALAPARPAWGSFAGRPLAGAVVIGAGCGYLFLAGLARAPAQRAAVLTYLEPLVASSVGVLVFGEPLSGLKLCGAAAILAAGVAVALQPPPTPAGSLARTE